ncbi:phage holin family protein [Streptomyces sp. G45]|uniref:phage holin family protein n=1 Tax=Streptomyces sp. G45 TaxID=3406627 RepID=UPI003C1D730D
MSSAPDAPVGTERSLGQLVSAASKEMSELVHDEIALVKAQVTQDIKRGAIGSAAFIAAISVLIFSLPMLNFALAYGIRTWSGWNMAICFVLSFAANVLVAGVLAWIGVIYAKKAAKGKGPQKAAAAAKETAAVLSNVKPHPRAVSPSGAPELEAGQGAKAVARSSS